MYGTLDINVKEMDSNGLDMKIFGYVREID